MFILNFMEKEPHYKIQKTAYSILIIGIIGILASLIFAPKKLIGFSILENLSFSNSIIPFIIFILSLFILLIGFFKNKHAEELKKRHLLFKK